MKKILLSMLLLLFGFQAFAQSSNRVTIEGTIQMPEGEDAQGISIYNTTSNRGTVTNEQGAFKIPVAAGDSLVISAIQFQEFTVVINEAVIDSRQININVNEVVNQLPEVVVSPFDLTGNVTVDITRLRVVQVPDTLNSFRVQSMYFEADAAPNYQGPPRNTALDMNYRTMEHGLNFANLVRHLLVTGRRAQAERRPVNLDTYVRDIYSDEFFREHLDIERENITDFIYYADENGLDEEMMKEGNELDLIEFLVRQSRNYKRQQARND